MVDFELSLEGPFSINDNFALVSFSIKNIHQNHNSITIIIITEKEKENLKFIHCSYTSLFEEICSKIEDTYKNEKNVSYFYCHVFNRRVYSPKPFIMDEDSLELKAKSILESCYIEQHIIQNNIEYHIKVFSHEAQTGRLHYFLEEVNSSLRVEFCSDEIIDFSNIRMDDFISSVMESEFNTNFQNMLECYAKDNYDDTFRCLYKCVTSPMVNDTQNVNKMIFILLEITRLFIKNNKYDYADFAAQWIGNYAEKNGNYVYAIHSYRFCCIANECLGRIDICLKTYEKAIALFEYCTCERLKAIVSMSYGISIIALISVIMDEKLYSPSERLKYICLLDDALENLTYAEIVFKDYDDDNARWNLASIELEIARVHSLENSLDRLKLALYQLANINNYNIIRRDGKLYTTFICYYLAAARKLSLMDNRHNEIYEVAIDKAIEVTENSSLSTIHSFYLHLWIGEYLLSKGEHEKAITHFMLDYMYQKVLINSEINAPRCAINYGGITLIDICNSIHKYLVFNDSNKEKREKLWGSLMLCEDTKCRLFQRDIAMDLKLLSPTKKGYVKDNIDYLKKQYLKGRLDNRYMLAEYRALLQYEINSEENISLKHPFASTDLSHMEELFNLVNYDYIFSSVNCNMIIMSFYANEDYTIVYLLRAEDKQPHSFKIDLSKEALQNIINNLNKGIMGFHQYGRIKFNKPWERDNYFKSFYELETVFQPMVEYLSNSDVIMVCPHSQWYSIPMHAILQPIFWNKGVHPSVVYSPSLNITELILRRSKEYDYTMNKNIAITTSPGSDTESKLFLESHNKYFELFKTYNFNLIQSFGESSTIGRFLEDTLNVSLHHITSHGIYDDNTINSGVKLSSSLLQGNHLMLNGTTADHITVQACSMGKNMISERNELWGFCRALLGCGANSILTPMWEISLKSSTKLIELFYINYFEKQLPKWKAWGYAQYELTQIKEYPQWAHFYHWAPFTLTGW